MNLIKMFNKKGSKSCLAPEDRSRISPQEVLAAMERQYSCQATGGRIAAKESHNVTNEERSLDGSCATCYVAGDFEESHQARSPQEVLRQLEHYGTVSATDRDARRYFTSLKATLHM